MAAECLKDVQEKTSIHVNMQFYFNKGTGASGTPVSGTITAGDHFPVCCQEQGICIRNIPEHTAVVNDRAMCRKGEARKA